METNKISVKINGKHIYSFSGILFSLSKEWSINTTYSTSTATTWTSLKNILLNERIQSQGTHIVQLYFYDMSRIDQEIFDYFFKISFDFFVYKDKNISAWDCIYNKYIAWDCRNGDCGKLINVLLKDICVLIPGTCDCYLIWQKKKKDLCWCE